ncbi:hypothetical protein C5167_039732 [Papaver somniferum]|uniref:Uncharacterized protein n=1 Tax=Papaver somniferum TaxID=3469 RepID=A0A4Y7ICX6_PAPSO|nr:hypothetical protein C5167_039732 [Papaver somniferum]
MKLFSISESLLQNTLNCLVDVVHSETASLASFAMQALGHIGLRGPMPVRHSGSGEILVVLQELAKLVAGEDIKAIQRTVKVSKFASPITTNSTAESSCSSSKGFDT